MVIVSRRREGKGEVGIDFGPRDAECRIFFKGVRNQLVSVRWNHFDVLDCGGDPRSVAHEPIV